MASKKNQSYIRSTLKFCIAGFFIPGLTVYPIVGLQMGIDSLGIACTTSWTVLWTITAAGTMTAPLIFIRLMNKTLLTGANFSNDRLMTFNVFELMFIQGSLAIFFSNGQTLCYGNGGQNGLEFIFTGWLALPFLIVFSLVFDKLREKKIEQARAGSLAPNEE